MPNSDAAKHAKLKAFLDALPSRHALQLLEACEAADARGDDGLPFDMMREALERRAEAATCNAFGLAKALAYDKPGPKRTGAIAEMSIAPIARLASEIAPEAYGRAAAGAPPLTENRRSLGRALRTAIQADDPESPRLQSRVGGARAYADLKDITALLCAEPVLSDGLEDLPEKIAELDETVAAQMCRLYDAVEKRDPQASLLLLFLYMERLEKRPQILRVLRKLVGHEDDLIASQTDVGAIGDRLLDEAEQAIADMAPPANRTPDGPAIVAAAARFAEISRGMTRELGIRRDGKWGLRLKDLRTRAGRAMEHLCDIGPDAIGSGLVLERVRLKGASTIVQPAIERPPSPAALDRALNYAIILGGLADFASACAFQAAYEKARDLAVRDLDSYCDGLLRFLGDGDDATARKVEPWLAAAGQVTAHLLDEGAADVLRRRAVALRPAHKASGAA